MDIILVTTVITSLFLLIGGAEPLAHYLRLPYAVIIACLGILVGAAATFFLRTDLTDALNPLPLQSSPCQSVPMSFFMCFCRHWCFRSHWA